MGLFSRPARSSVEATPQAVYARAIDGEHVWLAMRGEGPLVLRGDGVEIAVDATADVQPDGELLVAVVPVAPALAELATVDVVTLRLLAGPRATPVAWAVPRVDTGPALLTPTTSDGAWQLTVEDDAGSVVVRRTRLAPVHTIVSIATDGDDVVITLAGGARLLASELTPPEPGTTRAVLHQGAPLVRHRNVLERPHASVGLPPLPGAGCDLRWLKDGRLAVHRRDVEPSIEVPQ
ncbi:hypothetical protein [Nocardioides sp. R-C-SC26]|uniref:hypothetical protein n=1 Tax=Nocardioides sp. R-C-SC26 TaxID=2870414 RepID=UPI001E443A21|nr:hypothetical protein [Nocardioides sp. R-C-SC26]